MIVPSLHDKHRRSLLRFGTFLTGVAIALTPLTAVPAVPRSPAGSKQVASFTAFEPEPRPTMIPLGQRNPFTPQAADLPQGAITRAVLLGTVPRAIVEIGSDERLVSIGDPIAGVTVSAIDDLGVVLSDGSRIPLSGNSH